MDLKQKLQRGVRELTKNYKTNPKGRARIAMQQQRQDLSSGISTIKREIDDVVASKQLLILCFLLVISLLLVFPVHLVRLTTCSLIATTGWSATTIAMQSRLK